MTSDDRINTFLLLLFQADQLMFALHFVRGMHPELFQENVSARGESLQLKLNVKSKWIVKKILSVSVRLWILGLYATIFL